MNPDSTITTSLSEYARPIKTLAMRTPTPWRVFTIISLTASTLAAFIAGLLGHYKETYHEFGRGFAWTDITPGQRMDNTLFMGSVGFVAGLIGTFIVLLLLRLAWYFLLARLAEISKAVQQHDH